MKTCERHGPQPHPYCIDCYKLNARKIMETDSHPPTPCCGYVCSTEHSYAVFWNPLNGVVQCHNCGVTYAPAEVIPDIRGYWTPDGKYHEGMPPATSPNPDYWTP